MCYPNSFLSRVIKAKYHPHLSFLEVELGRLPSYTWRSVWATKKMLMEGIGWRIRSSTSISIFDDAWLPGSAQQKVDSLRAIPGIF